MLHLIHIAWSKSYSKIEDFFLMKNLHDLTVLPFLTVEYNFLFSIFVFQTFRENKDTHAHPSRTLFPHAFRRLLPRTEGLFPGVYY